MDTDGDGARLQEFSQSLWRVLRWTHKTLHIPSATPSFELLVALGASAESQLNYDELEAMTRRSHRAMQYVVHDMRAMGLIEVRSGAEDRRRRIIRISAAGLRLYREYCELMLNEMTKLTAYPVPLTGRDNGKVQSIEFAGAAPNPGNVMKVNPDQA